MLGGASVRIDELTKSFDLDGGGSLLVFDGLGLKIESGSFVAVLGPSGCGKSTLLRMIAGLEAPSAGRIEVAESRNPGRARIGLMLQGYPSLPWLTVAQNVALGTKHSKADPDHSSRSVVNLLSRVGLFGWQDAYPRELSGGMLQRLALARTLAMQPDLVLLDEPLGALDALTRTELQTLLREVHDAEGATFVMVTHDVEEALAVADRLVVLGPCGTGVLYDSDSANTRLNREGLVQLLASTHATFAAGTWIGYMPFAQNPQANGSAFRLWMGLSDIERVAALRSGRAAAGFFTVQALAELGDELQDLDPAVVHAFSQPLTVSICEHVLLSPHAAAPGPGTRWAATGGLEKAIIRRLDHEASDSRIEIISGKRADCVVAVAEGRADACVVDLAFARRVLGWWKFRQCTARPLPDDVWQDLWTVVVASRRAACYKDGALARAVRALAREAEVVRRRSAGSVHYFTGEESHQALSDGSLASLLGRWGGISVPADPTLLRGDSAR